MDAARDPPLDPLVFWADVHYADRLAPLERLPQGLNVNRGTGHAPSSSVPLTGIAQLNAAILAACSSSLVALRARKLIPRVPKFSALPACGAPLKTSLRQVTSKLLKPVVTTVASSSASSRAPAIHPVQRSILRLALSGTAFCTRMSPIWSRPPGFSTRDISSSAAALAGIRLSTPFESTPSAQPAATGSASA